MLEPIFSPLQYYLNTAKKTHADNVNTYLSLLSQEAKVDKEANAKTVAELNDKESKLTSLRNAVSGKKTVRTLLIIGIILTFFIVAIWAFEADLSPVAINLILLGACGAAIFGIVFSCKKINAKLRSLNEEIARFQSEANKLLDRAWEQAKPLNTLFTDDASLKLFTKTLPFITFDDCFTDARLNELSTEYGFPAGISEDDCILDTLSGELYGSPFVYVQKLHHYLGTKTYTGSLTITWTTHERDYQGRTVTRTHSEVLHASIVRPAPYYSTDTALYFGNHASPNLNFSRSYAHVEDKSEAAIARTVRKGEKKIKRLEEKALKIGDDFQGVTNTEFDVLFGATDRTDDLEFLQMFTPRAQESMLELLLHKDGYGDDFSFAKNGELCIIRSEHAQGNPLFPTASEYQSYNVVEAESAFLSKNEGFFQSIYFDFAPLLLIPPYQQPLIRSEPIRHGNLTAYNYEAIACRLSSQLQPDGADTRSIFKTSFEGGYDGADRVQVCAYAYNAVERVHYERVFGGDGHWHDVPVYWTEYIPVSKTATMSVSKEKPNDATNGYATYYGYYANKI